jgi:hypothetical protein
VECRNVGAVGRQSCGAPECRSSREPQQPSILSVGQQSSGAPECRCSGTPEQRSTGVSEQQSAAAVGRRGAGMAGCRDGGVLGRRSAGVVGWRGAGVPGWRSAGIVKCRGSGVVGCASNGAPECASNGVLQCRSGVFAGECFIENKTHIVFLGLFAAECLPRIVFCGSFTLDRAPARLPPAVARAPHLVLGPFPRKRLQNVAYSWCYGPYFKSGNLAHLSGNRTFSSSYKNRGWRGA